MKKPLLDKTTKPLSEKEEQLLMRFQDGEASWREQWIGRRLISTRAEARAFLQDLGICGEFVEWRAHRMLRQLPPVWTLLTEVQRDIDRQQCVRNVVVPTKGRWGLAADTIARAGWGMTGALTAASVMIFMMPPTLQESTRGQEQLIAQGITSRDAEFPAVTLSSTQSRAVERSKARVTRSYPLTSSSVDGQYGITWFSSGGKMQIIGGRSANSPVLWVSRNGRVSRRASPTPSIPSAVFASEKRANPQALLSR